MNDTILPDSLEAQLATITTDTGSLAVGPRSFANYDFPELCQAAASRTLMGFRRTLAVKALDQNVLDTVGLEATAPLARACGARFTVATVQPKHLKSLFILSLYEHNDSLAAEVLSALASRGNRVDALKDGIRGYFAFRRWADLAALMAQIDAQGASDHKEIFDLHAFYMELMTTLPRNILGQYFDSTLVRAAIDPVLKLEPLLPPAQRAEADQSTFMTVLAAYRGMADLLPVRQATLDALHVLAEPIKLTLNKMDAEMRMHIMKAFFYGTKRASTEDSILFGEFGIAPPGLAVTHDLAVAGRRAPRLAADFWFPPPGRPRSDTLRPVPGKVNLICVGTYATVWMDNSSNLTSMAYGQANTIRKLIRQYGADGLEVTVVWPAGGWSEYYPNEFAQFIYRTYHTAIEEADVWRWFTQEYEQLPVTVVVQRLHDTWLPAPDGRRDTESGVQVLDFFSPRKLRPGACAIVNKDGNIMFSDPNQSPIDALHWLFDGPGAVSHQMSAMNGLHTTEAAVTGGTKQSPPDREEQ